MTRPTIHDLIAVIRDDRQMSKTKRDAMVDIAEHVARDMTKMASPPELFLDTAQGIHGTLVESPDWKARALSAEARVDALVRALGAYPPANPQRMQARAVCAGVSRLADEILAGTANPGAR